MTWTASYEVNGTGPVRKSNVESVEHMEQFAQATQAVADLIRSGVLGDVNDVFVVNISGHANPGHEPISGWSDDHLSFSISRKVSK